MKICSCPFVSSIFLVLVVMLTGCDSGGGGGGSSEPRTVLVMGDSISAGGSYSGVPPWPSLLAADQPAWTIINASSPGEKMESGAGRLPGQLARHNPDELVLFYGANNAVQGDTGNFEASLRGAIQAGLASGLDRVVVCTTPRFYGARVIFNGTVDVIDQTIRTVAAEEGAFLVDVAREFGPDDGDLFPDGIHPNLDGQRIIMVTVRAKL